MSEDNFGSVPDIIGLDFTFPLIDQASTSIPLAFRSRNTVSLSALTRVEPKFDKDLIAALKKECPGFLQFDSEEIDQSKECLRCRSLPAIFSRHKSKNICHGFHPGLSTSQENLLLQDVPQGETGNNKISDRMKFILIIVSVLMIFAAVRFVASE